jgi:thiol-disulfide isomerase/thioredoxin
MKILPLIAKSRDTVNHARTTWHDPRRVKFIYPCHPHKTCVALTSWLIPGFWSFGSNESLSEPGPVRRFRENGRASRACDPLLTDFNLNTPKRYISSGAIKSCELKPSILTQHHLSIDKSIMPVTPINSKEEFGSIVSPAISLQSVSDAHTLINPSTLQINSGKVVVIDFWATWCGPCRFISPILEQMSEINTGIEFRKVDVDEQPDISQEVGIRAVSYRRSFLGRWEY